MEIVLMVVRMVGKFQSVIKNVMTEHMVKAAEINVLAIV